jgi:cytochrome c oxidase subunit 4
MADEEERYHPGTSEYIQIGIILAVLTGIEVSLYFFDLAEQIAIPLLLALTAMKFVLVGFWFMHLRFDSPLFRRLFFLGAALAFVIFTIVGLTFQYGPA